MPVKIRSIVILSSIVFLGFISIAFASEVSVEGLTLKKEHSNAWAIAGKVRNLESSPIKGYVKIKFLDSKGDITKTVKAYVNDMDPIGPGQAGPFEYWTSPSDFSGVSNYQVIFVDR